MKWLASLTLVFVLAGCSTQLTDNRDNGVRTDSTHEPTVVTQPDPVIVPSEGATQ